MMVLVLIIPESMTHSPDSSSDDGGINSDPSVSTEHKITQQNWVLSKTALDMFLASLSPDRNDAGQKYEALRKRLVRFFEWRGCDSPDYWSDQTIDRVVRKIHEGQDISNLTPFILTVARLVAKEAWRVRIRKRSLDSDMSEIAHPSIPNEVPKLDPEETDHRLSCFDRCLESLSPASRDLILSYYQEDRHEKIVWRKRLAEQLGVPLNALRIKAYRIRRALERCIEDCLAQVA